MSYRWRFRILLFGAAGLGLWFVLKNKHFPPPLQSYLLIAGFTVAMWCFILILSLQQSEEEPHLDLIECFREDAAFRFILWRQGLIMLLGAMIAEPHLKQPLLSMEAWPGLAGIALFFVAWGVMVYQTDRHLKVGMPDKDAHLPASARRLKNGLTYGTLFSLPFVKTLGSHHTENLISELAFWGIAAPICGLLAFGMARLLARFVPKFPNDQGYSWQLQLTLWILGFLVLLASAGVINRRIPISEAKAMRVFVDKKGENWKKKQHLYLHIHGKSRKFRPDRASWAQIPESDSITVYVRTGALGFDFIEKFGE